MAVVLETRGLNKSFGAVTAAADINVAVETGQRGRTDRQQRRRQDHVHQHGDRLPETDFREHRLRRPRHHTAGARARSRGSASAVRFRSRSCSTRCRCTRICWSASASWPPARRKWADAIALPAPPEQTVDTMLERFNLTGYRDKPAGVLPEGVRKLLDIAMAMAVKPKILLLDEPTSGVSADEKFGLMDMVMEAVRAQRRHGAVRRARHGYRQPLYPSRAGVLRGPRSSPTANRASFSTMSRCAST